MKRNVLATLATMVACAAAAAIIAFFTPAFNVLAGERGDDAKLMLNDTFAKARHRSAIAAGAGAVGGFFLAAYARRLRRKSARPC